MRTFTPKVHVESDLGAPFFNDYVIETEPMLFSADIDFAYRHGGSLTRYFLGATMKFWRNEPEDTISIDSRSHMLMPGMYPCIPGWHHDDIYRGGPMNQPIYDGAPYRTEHACMVVGKSPAGVDYVVASPEFLMSPITVNDPLPNERTYESWDAQIAQQRLGRPDLYEFMRPRSGDIVYFDDHTFHRGMAATENVWRFFIRITKGRPRTVPPKIRKQVNVYMPTINAGW